MPVEVINRRTKRPARSNSRRGVRRRSDEHLLYESVRHHLAARAGMQTKTRHRSPGPARNCGGRRAQAGRVWAPSGRLCGAMAARRTGRSRATTLTACRKMRRARCARRCRQAARRAVKVVESFDFSDHKTDGVADLTGDARHARKTLLLVAARENKNLASARATWTGVNLLPRTS